VRHRKLGSRDHIGPLTLSMTSLTEPQCPSCGTLDLESLPSGSFRCRSEEKIFGYREVFRDAPRPAATEPKSTSAADIASEEPEPEAGIRCPTCGSPNMKQLETGSFRCIDEQKIFGAAEVAAASKPRGEASAQPSVATGHRPASEKEALKPVRGARNEVPPIASASRGRPDARSYSGWTGNLFAIRDVPDPTTLGDYEALGLLYPVPSELTDTVLLEPRDGAQVRHFTTRSFELQQGGAKVASSSSVTLHLYITDARVVFACSKYDKGSLWVGNSPLALPLTVASKAMAAARRRGKMLVGQIRYPSLGAVGSTARTGMFERESVMFAAATEDHLPLKLTCVLQKQENAAAIAAEIARRTAAFRLAADPDVTSEMREELEALRDVAPRPAPHGEQRFHRMPTPSVICERAARFAAPRSDAPDHLANAH